MHSILYLELPLRERTLRDFLKHSYGQLIGAVLCAKPGLSHRPNLNNKEKKTVGQLQLLVGSLSLLGNHNGHRSGLVTFLR